MPVRRRSCPCSPRWSRRPSPSAAAVARPRRRRTSTLQRPVLQLECPDLRMAPPGDLRVRKVGKVLRLLATNHIVNVGAGALELRAEHTSKATRDGYRFASAYQVIRNRRGAPVFFPEAGYVYWKAIPGQGHYWKYWRAARFELWTLNPDGTRAAHDPHGPEALLLLPRPQARAHVRALAQAPRLPGLQPELRPQGAAPRRLPRLGRHLPVDLPRELDQHHRPAGLLRLRAPRRSARRHRRRARGRQHRPADDPAAAAPWQRRAARLPRPR